MIVCIYTRQQNKHTMTWIGKEDKGKNQIQCMRLTYMYSTRPQACWRMNKYSGNDIVSKRKNELELGSNNPNE